jgi:protein-L-isoaspartate O-methyltransferase
VENNLRRMENNLNYVKEIIKEKLGDISEEIMTNLIERAIRSHTANPNDAIDSIQGFFSEDDRFELKEINYDSNNKQFNLYVLVNDIEWPKHYTFSSDGSVVQIGRKISEEEIVMPSWMEKLPPSSMEDFKSIFLKFARSEFLPEENIEIGRDYELLEKYEPYYAYALYKLNYAPKLAFRAILTAFLNETTKLIELRDIFGSGKNGEKILDLGVGSWFYAHLLKAYFNDAEKIIGIEKQYPLVESARKTLKFWGLDTDGSIAVAPGDMTDLDNVPLASGKFDRITIFNALVFFSQEYGVQGNFNKIKKIFQGIRERLSEGGKLVITIGEKDVLTEEDQTILQLFQKAGFKQIKTVSSSYEAGIYDNFLPEEIPDKARELYLKKLLFDSEYTLGLRRENNLAFIADKEKLDKFLDLLPR